MATHVQVGRTVLVWTRGYHWVGRLSFVSALEIVLEAGATCFVDLGQIDQASRGEWSSDAHGRQVAGATAIPRLSCEISDWPYPLPTQAIG